MSADSAVSIAWDVFKWLVDPIKLRLGYVIRCKKYDDDLREIVRSLGYEVDRIQNAREEAERNLRNVYSNITEWQANAEKALKEAQELLDNFETVSKNCCHGTLPDPCCRYKFSRNAEDAIEGIQKLAQECAKFKELSYSGPAPGEVAASTSARREGKDVVQPATARASVVSGSKPIKPSDAGIFESRASMIKKIMDALADNNNNVVGIYGMGGVGKSTLLAAAERKIREENSFDWIAKVQLSEHPEIKRIQEEIAHALDLNIKNKEYDSMRAEFLQERLVKEGERKKVLIILDNLWERLDLKLVGIPCGPDNKVIGCKLLLVSRECEVLEREMGCDKLFHLCGLKEDEAKRLFESIVGDKAQEDEFQSWVKVALDGCAGVPFLIVAMAKRLKNAELDEWKDTLRKIKKSEDKEINNFKNDMLWRSYDKLEDDVKSLLQLCVVYGVSNPSLENLVRYGFGLGIFKEVSNMEEARGRLNSHIRALQASSLLLDSEDVSSFKIHDLVREFVASVVSKDHPFLVLKDKEELALKLPKDKPISYRDICFPNLDMEDLPEELDCPELRMFLLFMNNKSLHIPDSLFNSMRKLMVLNLTGIHFTCSPSSIQFLENLHTLYLDDCPLDNVAILGELKQLQILSFVNSSIRRLPKKVEQLTKLRLLDLDNCSQLREIEPGVLGSLTKLEELYMEDSFDNWNAVDQTPATNASLTELNNMKNLLTLCVSVPDPSVIPENLNVEKLTKYKIRIGNSQPWERERKRRGFRTLELKLDPRNSLLHKGCIQSILDKTDDLLLDKLDGKEQSICMFSQERFPKLKHLQVENSPSIRYVLQSLSHMTLESLVLKNLISLENICHNSILFKSFTKLKVVRVHSCHKMEVLFPLSLLRELRHLKEIRVLDCHLMREIIEDGMPDIDFSATRTTPSSSISDDQVGTQLAFFNEQVSIPPLESLTMDELPNVRCLWSNESSLMFSNLRHLRIVRCKLLLKVINSMSLEKLLKLDFLEIQQCDLVEEIFDLVGPSTSGNTETLSELTTFYLHRMPSLRSIWNKSPCGIVSFHKLKRLEVSGCDNLGFLFFPSMVQSLARLKDLQVWDCKNMKVIIMEEEGLGMEKSETLAFQMLTYLTFSRLESLTCFYRGKCSQAAQNQDQVKSHSIALFNPEVVFPNKKSLDITGMDNIEMIWDNQDAADCFHELKSLRVFECNKLKCIWHKDPYRSVSVSKCKSVASVIPASIAKDINECAIVEPTEKEALYPRFLFPKLSSLELKHLPELKSIYTGTHLPHWPALKTLDVDDCNKVEILASHPANVMPLDKQPLFLIEKDAFPNLETLHITSMDSMEMIWNNQIAADSFPNLEFLCVHDCNKLKCVLDKELHRQVKFQRLRCISVSSCRSLTSLFPASVAENLIHLEELEISKCGIVELIEKEALDPTFVFPKLTSLKLKHLPELKTIYTGTHPPQWPALKTLKVHGCNKVEIFASHPENEMPLDKQPLFLVEKDAFPSLETLHITSMDSINMIWNNQAAADSFYNLESLCVQDCNKLKCILDKELHCQVKFQRLRRISVSSCRSLTSLFPASVAGDLIHLEELEINECGIVELIEKEALDPTFAFLKLTSFKLKHLPELKTIYTGTHPPQWPALKTLEVYGCNKVKIFASHPDNDMPLDKQPLFLVEKGTFPKLQELKLDLSGQMEIWHGQFHDEEFLYTLRVLELRYISKESSISTCWFIRNLTNLEKLVVCESYLEDLSTNVEAIEDPRHGPKVSVPPSRHIQHLTTLVVSHCDVLSNIFTPIVAENLVELSTLKISNCKMLREVINDEGGKEGHVVPFHQLKYMELDGLTGLRCFSPCRHTLMFPLLENVIVIGCPNMKFFSQGQIEAPKLEKVHALEGKVFWKGNLNITIQYMFEEMAAVAEVEFMRLSEFPELTGKWHNKLIPIQPTWELETLMVDNCPSFINVIPSRLMPVLDNMVALQACNCRSLEEIFDLEDFESVEGTQVLSKLIFLYLVDLPKLRRLWNEDLQGTLRFKSLTALTLYNCSNLKHALAPSMAGCIDNLTRMEIKECGQIKAVIAKEEEGQGCVMEIILFPNLEYLELESLPNLISFLSGNNHMLECPELRELIVAHCPKMRSLTWQPIMEIDHGSPSFFTPQVQFSRLESMVLSHMDNLIKIWTDTPQETLAFDRLREVEVRNNKSLENIFPNWVATGLIQLKKLQVESCGLKEIITSGGDTPQSSTARFFFPTLTSLVLHDMPQLKSFCPDMHTMSWPFLKELRVTHCDRLNLISFEATVNKWTERDNQRDLLYEEAHSTFEMDFPNLERLLLVDKDIQMIQDEKISDDFFGKAKALTLACCHDEKTIFPLRFLVERFQNLQSLEILCSSFEDIFPDEGVVDEGNHLVLGNLRELKINKLHNLKHVWREDYLVAKILQSIETFEVWDCPSLTTIFPAKLSFQNLTELVVKNSSGLVYLVTVSAVANLVHLTNMTIIGCETMKEVVTNDGTEEGKVISLEKLERLRLQNLPSLVSFSSTTSCGFRFPSLFDIVVEECPKMKTFSKGELYTPSLQYVTLFRYFLDYNWYGDLNRAIQELTS